MPRILRLRPWATSTSTSTPGAQGGHPRTGKVGGQPSGPLPTAANLLSRWMCWHAAADLVSLKCHDSSIGTRREREGSAFPCRHSSGGCGFRVCLRGIWIRSDSPQVCLQISQRQRMRDHMIRCAWHGHRRGKVAGAGVQYTLRSGRRLRGGGYQAPLAALVCNFPPDPAAPLTAAAASTLFHEYGHVGAPPRTACGPRSEMPCWGQCGRHHVELTVCRSSRRLGSCAGAERASEHHGVPARGR